MKLKQNKKAATTELIFLFSLFGIVLILSVFYIWIQKNITDQAKNLADNLSGDLERRIFFSDLIRTNGLDIANKDDNGAETAIENFANQYAIIKDGSYSADCSTVGIDKECTLQIITYDVTTPSKIFGNTKTSAYLPMSGNKAIRFTLDLTILVMVMA